MGLLTGSDIITKGSEVVQQLLPLRRQLLWTHRQEGHVCHLLPVLPVQPRRRPIPARCERCSDRFLSLQAPPPRSAANWRAQTSEARPWPGDRGRPVSKGTGRCGFKRWRSLPGQRCGGRLQAGQHPGRPSSTPPAPWGTQTPRTAAA